MNATRSGFEFILALTMLALFVLSGCSQVEADPVTVPPIKELVVCSWQDDAIGLVLDTFYKTYGIRARLFGYSSQGGIIKDIRAGYNCDVLVVQSDFVPALAQEGLIAEIDFTNVLNFRNIAANFRNLAYDPYNKYSIPYSWGTTGLIVRSDLVAEGVDEWKDLWNESYRDQVAVWISRPRYIIGAALLSLGYSVNSENPQELEAAFQILSQLKQQAIWLEQGGSIVPLLMEGKVLFGMGWANDFWQAKEDVESVEYVLPGEGSILWSDVFTIPSNSPNKKTATLLINFFLQPEISAQIINTGHYAIPNDLALPLVNTEVRENPVIYPAEDVLQNAAILLPLSQQGQLLYDSIWERFLALNPGE